MYWLSGNSTPWPPITLTSQYSQVCPLMIPLKKKKTKKQVSPIWDAHKLSLANPAKKTESFPIYTPVRNYHHEEPHLRIPITILRVLFNVFLSKLFHLWEYEVRWRQTSPQKPSTSLLLSCTAVVVNTMQK